MRYIFELDVTLNLIVVVHKIDLLAVQWPFMVLRTDFRDFLPKTSPVTDTRSR
jgi:hypothetical protein